MTLVTDLEQEGELITIDSSFRLAVEGLVDEGKKIVEINAELTERTLKFAEGFKAIWDMAETLDKRQDGDHFYYLREQMAEVINTQDKAIRSRWVKIGSQASKLLPMASSLPPYRDTLYELALASEEKKPVKKWVKDGQLNSETSFRDVKRLRRDPVKKPEIEAAVPPPRVRREFPALVTFSFSTFSEAALALGKVMSESDVEFKVSADKAFEHALQEALSDEVTFEAAKVRLST